MVPTAITTTDLTSVDPSSLAGVDLFVSAFCADADSAPFDAVLRDYFLAGGSLLLLDDTPISDGIADLLGIPTIAGSTNPSTGGAPLFDGAFGLVASVTQLGGMGHLSPTDVSSQNGTVCAANAVGEITAACWAAGAYAPGSGSMVILGDVDMISFGGGAAFDPLNDKGRFALNTFAFLVPEPGTAWLIGAKALILALQRRFGKPS